METVESVEELRNRLAGVDLLHGSVADRVALAALTLLCSEVAALRSELREIKADVGLSDEAMLHISQVQRTNELLEEIVDALPCEPATAPHTRDADRR